MPTGGGKSLLYQLPALMLDGTAVVVSPLIALMKNQVDSLRAFSHEKGVAHVLNSSLSKKDVQQVQSDLLSGITKLLYVAPESLGKQENIDLLQQVGISFYAIDEAHCISEWGHDFRPEYRNLRQIMGRIEKPVIALTATATKGAIRYSEEPGHGECPRFLPPLSTDTIYFTKSDRKKTRKRSWFAL